MVNYSVDEVDDFINKSLGLKCDSIYFKLHPINIERNGNFILQVPYFSSFYCYEGDELVKSLENRKIWMATQHYEVSDKEFESPLPYLDEGSLFDKLNFFGELILEFSLFKGFKKSKYELFKFPLELYSSNSLKNDGLMIMFRKLPHFWML